MNNCGGIGAGLGAATGPYDAKIAGLYDLLDTLGSGHFAVVKLARHVFTGEKVAVKVIDKSKLDEVSKSHLFQEVRCMKLVQHPNVVRLYEVIDTQTKLYLILELGDGGDLYDYIMRHESGLSESLARDYFRQIVRAISYCHRLHVVHRDLKPENVVFFEKLGVVKLTDFGFSNKFCPGQKLETSCGSLAYSAPEILLGDSYDAPAVDVWSLGVILYMLVCGQAPFQEANDSETLTMIMDCKYTIPPHMSNSCKRLIGRMLVRDPEKRATLSEIATDPWVTAGEGITIEDFDTPLVTKEQLSEDDRTAIIQKMVNGTIATKEEIVECLEKNDYNHITATYYLLAERKLRTKRMEVLRRQEATRGARRPEALSVARSGMPGAAALVPGAAPPGRSLLAPPTLSAAPRTPQDVPPARSDARCPLALSVARSGVPGAAALVPGAPQPGRSLLAPPTLSAAPRTPQDVPPRSRKCSIVREEEDDEESAVASTAEARRGSRSEGRLHLAARQQVTPAPTLAPASARPAQLADNLTKRKTKSPRTGTAEARRGSRSEGRLHLAARQQVTPAPTLAPASARPAQLADNLTKVNLGEGGARGPECRRRRGGSCSSSDLSDDDSEKKKRAADHRPPPDRARRDSHDDSSDSQERGSGAGTGGPGSGRSAARTLASAPPANGAGAGDARAPTGGGSSGGGRRRRGARHESRLRESRSLNRIAEVEEAAAARWAGGGIVALCGRPLLRLLAAARPAPSARRLHGLC